MTLLEVDGLAKRFGGRTALDGLSLNLKRGEILALLGPTGAGKTTTLLSIAGLVKPDRGQVRIDGRDMTKADPRLRDVAVVFEGFNLLPTLSVRDNIAFPLRSPVYHEEPAEVERRVKKAAEDLRISHLLDRMTDQLSGGERQRVAVARALVRDPLFYLLDEPLSALDLKLRESLRAELRALQQQKSATILYATHDFHGAAAIADRIALIAKGRILQIGTLEEIIANPHSAEVGRLIGSPSMALLPGRLREGKVEIDGYGEPIPAPGGLGSGPVTVGIWPEDIDASDGPLPGYREAAVTALDFRGMDQAIQAVVGSTPLRKVVPLSETYEEGGSCWLRIRPETVFLFDAATGARLDAGEGRR